jgi:hypothetical protein
MHAKMEAVAEPVVPAMPEMEALEKEADMEEDDSTELSILHALNED